MVRSTRPEVFGKKVFLEIENSQENTFARDRCFPVNLAKHLQWLFLDGILYKFANVYEEILSREQSETAVFYFIFSTSFFLVLYFISSRNYKTNNEISDQV